MRTLQELQDSFTALTRLTTTIHDADGRPVTSPTDAAARDESDRVLDWLMADEVSRGDQGPLTAPIIVEGQQLGSITLHTDGPPSQPGPDAASTAQAANRPAAVQFLYLMANSIARLCYQEFQLRQRIDELTTLYAFSTELSQQRDLQHLLDNASRVLAEALGVKAAGIRLLDDDKIEAITRAVYNLSEDYLSKGPILLEMSPIFQEALSDGIAYVQDMRHDPRVIYPEDAQREGLASMLCAGVIYQAEPIGVVQLFTGEPRQFSRYETDLLSAMAHLLAAAINNAKLAAKSLENLGVERQLNMARDVQLRMLPQTLPTVAGFEIAARYVPSFEVGGDFYDFIDLPGNLGLAVADVSGKGLAASLLMAAVRSSLRAYAQDLYDIDQIVSRVNVALSRDTLMSEFATLFYGVLDPVTRRMTYCNAGHEPPLLLRRGKIIRLEAGGMVVGVDPNQTYERGILTFEPGDMLLLYTDGLMDALNFSGERFGRPRVIQALRDAGGRIAHDAVNHVLWEMRRFAGLNPRMDDTTLVVIRCTR